MKNAKNRVEWDEAVYSMVEERLDVTRGDAQGIVEVRQAEMDRLFDAGVEPEEAAELVAPTTSTRGVDEFLAEAKEALTGNLARETLAELLAEAVEMLREVRETPTYSRAPGGHDLILRPFQMSEGG